MHACAVHIYITILHFATGIYYNIPGQGRIVFGVLYGERGKIYWGDVKYFFGKYLVFTPGAGPKII